MNAMWDRIFNCTSVTFPGEAGIYFLIYRKQMDQWVRILNNFASEESVCAENDVPKKEMRPSLKTHSEKNINKVKDDNNQSNAVDY